MKFPIKKTFKYIYLNSLNSKLIGKLLSTKTEPKKNLKITSTDKILLISPHPDDEIISCGGLIQIALKNQAKIKIIYITNGGNNPISIISQKKSLKNKNFIKLGKQRFQEAHLATKVLGLNSKNLIFLDYPDGEIKHLYHKNHQSKKYTKKNLLNNLKKIFNRYQPNIIIIPNLKDKDNDHQTVDSLTQEVIADLKIKPKIYTFLVHYPFYPPLKKIKINESLYPPKKLCNLNNWYSLKLSQKEETIKLRALQQNKSQLNHKKTRNFLESFIKKNEIFQKINP